MCVVLCWFGFDYVWWLVLFGNLLKVEGLVDMVRCVVYVKQVMQYFKVIIMDVEQYFGICFIVEIIK